MSQVLIIADGLVPQAADQPTDFSDPTIAALKQAIHVSQPDRSIQVIGVNAAVQQAAELGSEALLCPLTLNLPKDLRFPAQEIYQLCQDTESLRQWVNQRFDYPIGDGQFWLPIILTPKGPLYAEAIATLHSPSAHSPSAHSPTPPPLYPSTPTYHQPLHLSDAWRQKLYRLAARLLRSLSTPPATYLMQFGTLSGEICFDRLYPFPGTPAIASLGVQTPDLFMCHWHCLTGEPILDVLISSNQPYCLLSEDGVAWQS